MPKTLLAVDDSATMRKVLEITFAGEDFRVISAEGASNALARLSDDPAVAVIDMSLTGDDGYTLAREVRSRNARIALVLMASRYSPYDANRGRDAGVDDFIDKPFDTQMLIDKVKKALVAREASRATAPPVPVTTQPLHPTAPFGAAPRPPVPSAAPPTKPTWQTQRTHTLSFESNAPPGPAPMTPAMPAIAGRGASLATSASPASPTPTLPPPTVSPPPAAPPPAPVPPAPPPPAPVLSMTGGAAAAPAAANGHFAGKLDDLGLTADQVRAVLALSRDLIEKVVWEVVPQLAETIIKEEIARLTKEG